MEGRSLKRAYHETKEKYQKKHISRWWFAAGFVALILVAEVVAQVCYSPDKARIYVAADGVNVSRKNSEEIKQALLDAYESTIVTIENPSGEPAEFSLAELGASVNVDGQVAAALDYPLGWRLVPFSILFPQTLEVTPEVSLAVETSLANKLPVDAQIVVEGGLLRVIKSQLGLEVGGLDADPGVDICSDSLSLSTSGPNTIHCNITVLKPVITTEVANRVAGRVRDRLKDGVTFSYQDGKVVEAGFLDAVNWLIFSPNLEAGTIDVEVGLDRVQGYLEKTELAELNVGARSNKVSMLNGVVTAQTTGEAGLGINYQGVVDDLVAFINNKTAPMSKTISVTLANINPGTVYDRAFTDDFRGLSAELEYLYGDKNVAIVTLDLTGRGRNIYVNQWKQFTSASTYKLYVAYSMLKDPAQTPSCFEAMIINSDNACPEAWLTSKGLKSVENEVHDIGVSAVTSFGNYDMRTSAQDLADFLVKIYRKELPIDNDRLINDMKVQRFRSGIPAGLGGNAIVADKVGFLWGLLHDAGIVYSNKGDYIQVILTDGYSWDTIADISARIYDKM